MNIQFDSEEEQGRWFSLVQKTKKCPTCNGTGIGGVSGDIIYDSEGEGIDCPECKGSGYVIQEEES